MCGICGVVQLGAGERREVIPQWALDRMTDVMTHRGPNDRGTYLAPGIALGVRRLSIVDVDGGHQPLSDETGAVWAVQNGELYNHVDVRERLGASGHRFRTRCDTEVIPHLYRRHGPLFPRELRGKFGLAVWDSTMNRAVIARDRLGIKPIYYAQVDDLLIFGSELKSVLASGLVSTELDPVAIDEYLSFGFFAGPRTPLAQVSKLMPGHLLVADEQGVRLEQYWEYPQPARNGEQRSVEDWTGELLDELDEAVRLRLMSDVPLGAMLSGGLDSSLVVALMARHMSEPVKTFSVGFRESGDGNELADARLVASAFGTDHHELELSFIDDTVDLPTLSWYMDEPLADLSALGFLALSQLAAQHVTVALSGQGADELFGGYRKHRAAALLRDLQAVRGPVTLGASLLGRRSRSFARLSRALSAPTAADRLFAMSSHVDAQTRKSLVGPALRELAGDGAKRTIQRHAEGLHGDPLAETLYLDAQLALVDDMIHYFDRASMARSLEVRVPFLDHKVVEFAARVPTRLKVRRQTTKYVLKAAARGIVPDEIIDKRKIGFFHGAVGSWLRAQANHAIADYLLDPGARYTDYLDAAEVHRLVALQRAGRSDLDDLVLSLLMLEVWLTTYVPRAVSADVDVPRGIVAGAAQ